MLFNSRLVIVIAIYLVFYIDILLVNPIAIFNYCILYYQLTQLFTRNLLEIYLEFIRNLLAIFRLINFYPTDRNLLFNWQKFVKFRLNFEFASNKSHAN